MSEPLHKTKPKELAKGPTPQRGLLKKNGEPKKTPKQVVFNPITSRRHLLKMNSNNEEVPMNIRETTKRTNAHSTMHLKKNKNFNKTKTRFFEIDEELITVLIKSLNYQNNKLQTILDTLMQSLQSQKNSKLSNSSGNIITKKQIIELIHKNLILNINKMVSLMKSVLVRGLFEEILKLGTIILANYEHTRDVLQKIIDKSSLTEFNMLIKLFRNILTDLKKIKNDNESKLVSHFSKLNSNTTQSEAKSVLLASKLAENYLTNGSVALTNNQIKQQMNNEQKRINAYMQEKKQRNMLKKEKQRIMAKPQSERTLEERLTLLED